MDTLTTFLFGFSFGIISYRLFIYWLLKRIPETQKDLWELEYKQSKRRRSLEDEKKEKLKP